MLQNLGGKCFTLGLIGVLGWPMAVLYPLYRLTVTLLQIATEYERSQRLTAQSLFDLGRTAALLFAALQVLKILAIYAAVGQTSLLLGTAALLASVSPTVLKVLAPIVAPHVAQLDSLVSQVQTFDLRRVASLASMSSGSPERGGLYSSNTSRTSSSGSVGSMGNSTFSTGTHTSSIPSFNSDRVEELSDGERIPVARSVGTDTHVGAGGGGSGGEGVGYTFAEVEVLTDDARDGHAGHSTGLRRRI
jgi:hypothetical protein